MRKSQIIALILATSIILFLAFSNHDLHRLDFHTSSPYIRMGAALAISIITNMALWKWQRKQHTENA